MRITVDTSTCRGYASCMLEAPTVFDVDEDSNLVVLLMEHPPEDAWSAVETAARCCPTNSITLLED